MTSQKLDKLSVQIDDAADVVSELEVNADAEAGEKLDELRDTLKEASDAIDELSEDEHR